MNDMRRYDASESEASELACLNFQILFINLLETSKVACWLLNLDIKYYWIPAFAGMTGNRSAPRKNARDLFMHDVGRAREVKFF